MLTSNPRPLSEITVFFAHNTQFTPLICAKKILAQLTTAQQKLQAELDHYPSLLISITILDELANEINKHVSAYQKHLEDGADKTLFKNIIITMKARISLASFQEKFHEFFEKENSYAEKDPNHLSNWLFKTTDMFINNICNRALRLAKEQQALSQASDMRPSTPPITSQGVSEDSFSTPKGKIIELEMPVTPGKW